MRLLRVLVVTGSLTCASLACASLTAWADGQNRQFSQSLAQGYSELAKYAAMKLHDQSGQSYFQNKSDRAQANFAVDPEWPTNWTLTPALQQAMGHERDGLVAALARVNAGTNARTEAIAQVNFDCWVALSTVPKYDKESARCRDAFHAAMQLLGS